jgi:hypothetical protein
MLHVIEVGAEVNIDDSSLLFNDCLGYPVHRLMCCPFRTISIRPRLEISLEDRLQDQLECPLDHTITDSRDVQRELHLSPVRLWDGLRSVILSTRCAASGSKYSRNDA